ncbi:hypothetical protein E4T52_08027 [Aureobasidium sp. EXF-3400]|nr:hypothetical protein E4T51_03668 [Aureobasidium sp. EXF-12344]KAI4777017.1 hypothetical protein E4T52_08027 [Aureobasidium sp. EXF-3400]
MSLLEILAADPTAQIIVGSGENIKSFHVHKKLLCDSSTYFKAALNNGFAETMDQVITLDDEDPAIFSTFALWLYEGKLNKATMPPEKLRGSALDFLLRLYILANKRGILDLANDTITMLASYWMRVEVDWSRVKWVFPLVSRTNKLYELILDNAVMEMKDQKDISTRLDNADLPKEVLVDLVHKGNLFPKAFKGHASCFEAICHYHLHADQGTVKQEECIRRVQDGINSYEYYGALKQKVWAWN